MDTPKERHGCLTVWLALIVLVNGISALSLLLAAEKFQEQVPAFEAWMATPIAVLAVLNVLLALALFYWRKWAFYAFIVNNLLLFGLNVYAGIGVVEAFTGLAGIAILYGVLQLGGDRSGWALMSRRRIRQSGK